MDSQDSDNDEDVGHVVVKATGKNRHLALKINKLIIQVQNTQLENAVKVHSQSNNHEQDGRSRSNSWLVFVFKHIDQHVCVKR